MGTIESKRLGAGAKVRRHERAGQGGDDCDQCDLITITRKHERNGAEHDGLGEAIENRVEHGAARAGFAAGTRHGTIEDVEDRANQEEHATCDVRLAVHEHRGNRIEDKTSNRDLVSCYRNTRDAGHDAGDHAARTVCVFLLESLYAHCRKIRRAPTSNGPRPTNGRQ